MKKLLATLALGIAAVAQAATYTPAFTVDYQTCGNKPVVSGNSVTFGAGTTCNAGRVVSQQAYRNISKITATVDLSRVSQNYVNASFYMISNPTQPTVQPAGSNYCDAGGNNTSWNCREIDLLETNGNKIIQTTLHLGNGGPAAPQRYEYAFAATADNSCYNYSTMLSSPTATNGLHSLVTVIDMSQPFDIVTEFTYGTAPSMVVSYSQSGRSVIVYNSAVGTGAQGSGIVDMNDLTASMANGYWLQLSFWQGYSPTGPGSAPWWNNTCGWGSLCNSAGSYWSISNVVVTADSVISTKKKSKR